MKVLPPGEGSWSGWQSWPEPSRTLAAPAGAGTVISVVTSCRARTIIAIEISLYNKISLCLLMPGQHFSSVACECLSFSRNVFLLRSCAKWNGVELIAWRAHMCPALLARGCWKLLKGVASSRPAAEQALSGRFAQRPGQPRMLL